MNKLCKSVAKRLFRKRDLDSAKKDLRRIAKHCTDSFTAYGASMLGGDQDILKASI